MQDWIRGKNKHILIWAVLIIYAFSANSLYVHFFITDGKPVSSNIHLPAPGKGIVYKLLNLEPVRYNGKDLYQIRGYAFFAASPEQENTITVVLSSKTQNMAFSTSTVPFPNMIESYPNYTKGMDHAEFRVLLDKDALPPGTYQVGILLGKQGTNDPAYVQTSSVIKKTPNTITSSGGQ